VLGHRALEPHSYAMPRISLRCTDLPPVPAARQLDQPPILIVPRLRRQKPAAGRSEFCPLTAHRRTLCASQVLELLKVLRTPS